MIHKSVIIKMSSTSHTMKKYSPAETLDAESSDEASVTSLAVSDDRVAMGPCPSLL